MQRVLTVKLFSEIAESPDPEWLIEDLIPAGGLVLMCARYGQGKTFLGLDASLAIARGSRWNGLEVQQGAAFYVAAEGQLSMRVRAYQKHHGLEGSVLPFAAIQEAIDLFHPNADLEPLIAAAKAFAASTGQPLRLITLDTLAWVMAGGDENAGKDISALLANLARLQRETGAAILLIHHFGKDESRGARGHSSLVAAVDTSLEISSGILKVEKQRDGETGACFGFRLVQVDLGPDSRGKRRTSCVVQATDAGTPPHSVAKGTSLGGDAAKALEVLKGLATAPGKSVPMEQWRSTLVTGAWARRKQEATRKAFGRARSQLEEMGRIRIEGDHVQPID